MADDFDELLSAVDAGFMADDVVIGLSRLQRGADVDEHHLRALDRAEKLLTWLADPEFGPVTKPQSSLRQLVGFRHQAEEMAKSRLPAEDRAKYFSGFLTAFRTARSGQTPGDGPVSVDDVLDFFEGVAQETQSVAVGHIVTPAQPAWTGSALAGIC